MENLGTEIKDETEKQLFSCSLSTQFVRVWPFTFLAFKTFAQLRFVLYLTLFEYPVAFKKHSGVKYLNLQT